MEILVIYSKFSLYVAVSIYIAVLVVYSKYSLYKVNTRFMYKYSLYVEVLVTWSKYSLYVTVVVA